MINVHVIVILINGVRLPVIQLLISNVFYFLLNYLKVNCLSYPRVINGVCSTFRIKHLRVSEEFNREKKPIHSLCFANGIVLVRLTSTNEAVYGIWNTTAGGDSTPSSAGTNTGNYFPGEEPENAFDRSTYTKYMNFGVCSSSLMGYECGLNTGLYLTLQRNRSLLTSIRFCTAFDHEIRDPLTITIEGSNGPSYALTYGTSWTLIYNGSTNLQSITQRRQCGDNQTIPNNFWYSSYRILVTSKRNIDVGTQYSEIDLFGY